MITRDELLQMHMLEGARVYGNDWRGANIAWMSDEKSVTSKIYKPIRYLTSIITKDGIEHKEENL